MRTRFRLPSLLDGVVMTSIHDSTVTVEILLSSDNLQRIGHWVSVYALEEAEEKQLRAVLTDYPVGDIAKELTEELRCILASRKLATMPELTAETVDGARLAFESGRIPFVRQDVD